MSQQDLTEVFNESLFELSAQEMAHKVFDLFNKDIEAYFKYVDQQTKKLNFTSDQLLDDSWYDKMRLLTSILYVHKKKTTLTNPTRLNSILMTVMKLSVMKSPLTSTSFKILDSLLRHYVSELDNNILLVLLQHVSMFFISQIPSVQKCARLMAKVILSNLDPILQQMVMDKVLAKSSWTKTDYIFLINLIIVKDIKQLQHYEINQILNNVHRSWEHSHLTYEASDLLHATCIYKKLISLDEHLLPEVILWGTNGNNMLIHNIKQFAIKTFIYGLGGGFLKRIINTSVKNVLKVQTLWLLIKHGLIDADNYLLKIERYLNDPDSETQNIAFQCICERSRFCNFISAKKADFLFNCFKQSLIHFKSPSTKRSFEAYMQNFYAYLASERNNFDFKQTFKSCQAFFKNILYFCIDQLNMFTEASLTKAMFIFEPISLLWKNKFSSQSNAELEEVFDLFASLLKECTTASLTILLENLEKKEDYLEDSYKIIKNYLLNFISIEECTVLEQILKNSIDTPTYVCMQKCIQITSILIEVEKIHPSANISKMIVDLTNNLKINDNMKYEPTSSTLNSMAIWTVIFKEFNLENPTLALNVYHYADNLSNHILNCAEGIQVDFTRKKILENIIFNCIEVMHTILRKEKLENAYMDRFLSVAEDIICYSNMRRPVARAKELYEDILKFLPKNEEFVQKYLKDKLNAALSGNIVQQKIRRCPEASLIIHSIASSDKRITGKCITHLMQFLSNTDSDVSSTAAALFSLAALMQDKSLVSVSNVYDEEVMILGFEKFKESDYTIKNAAMQLIQFVSTRLLGQSSSSTESMRTFHDFHLINRKLVTYIFQALNNTETHQYDLILIILMFLSKFDSNDKCIITKHFSSLRDTFRLILKNLMGHHNNQISDMACKAFMSFIAVASIPHYAISIINYLVAEHRHMPVNKLVNFLALINTMKFYYYSVTKNRDCIELMECRYQELVGTIEATRSSKKLHSYLNLRSSSIDSTYQEYFSMLFQLNVRNVDQIYLKYVLNEIIEKCEPHRFEMLVNASLTTHNNTIREMCFRGILLRIVQNRYKLNADKIVLTVTTVILDEQHTFESSCILKLAISTAVVVFKSLDTYITTETYDYIIQHYEKGLDHKLFYEIYIMALAKSHALTSTDRQRACNLLASAEVAATSSDKLRRVILSELLIWFDRCITVEYRPRLLSIALVLLLEMNSDYPQLYNYINNALDIKCYDTAAALRTIPKAQTLLKYFCCIDAVKKFYFVWTNILMKKYSQTAKAGFYPVSNQRVKKGILLNAIFHSMAELNIDEEFSFLFQPSAVQ